MKYDFTSVIDRRGQDALALDSIGSSLKMAPRAPKDGFDPIPMWVADMSFPTVPTVPEAIIRRASHPLYGYFTPPNAYFDSIIRWQETRNGAGGLTAGCIGYENGVVGGVLNALRVLCSPGDSVLLHSPAYVGFTSSLSNNGYRMVFSPLVKDGQGTWRMDFSDMERKIAAHHIHAAIFCSPHNPTGRVWEREELEQAMALFQKYGVYVISDEIWSDILLGGARHIPTQSVSEDAKQRTVALYAPSKTFNLAGLVGAYHIVYSPWLRDRLRKEASLSHYNSMNLLSMHALMGAYCPEGAEWCDELCQVLTGNVRYAVNYIRTHFDGVEVFQPQGTYMLFPDCTGWCEAHGKTLDDVERAAWDVGVAVQDGRMFRGQCHIRMNLALPLSRVQEAFDRLDRYVFR